MIPVLIVLGSAAASAAGLFVGAAATAAAHEVVQESKDELNATMNKLLSGGIEGKQIVAVSLMKEIIHLRSDVNTLLKSFDLDLRMNYPLGTVFGYGMAD